MFIYSLIIWSLAILWLGGAMAGYGYGLASAALTAIGGGFLGILYATLCTALHAAETKKGK
jgi:hypothetical protein